MPEIWMPGAIRIESPRRNPLNGNGFRLPDLAHDGVPLLVDRRAGAASSSSRAPRLSSSTR